MASTMMRPQLKRKIQMCGEVMAKKPKNAVCTLHEMFNNVSFKVVDQAGPVHQPLFTMAVVINGIEYKGEGKTKKLAKQAAAANALGSLIQCENPPNIESCQFLPATTDFTNDDVVMEEVFEKSATPPLPNPPIQPVSKTKDKPIDLKGKTDKGPVMLLNELYPNATYEIVSEKGEQYNKYTTAVLVGDNRYEGTGASKKLSKAAAAKSALASLHNITFTPTTSPGTLSSPTSGSPIASEFEIPQVFADHLAKMVIQKFTDLVANDKDHSKRKVLAGLVMSSGWDIATCRVIAVTTGTKCIKGEHMSVNGATVYDCHAEIMARRCLKRFLYLELKKHLSESSIKDSVFLPYEEKAGFKLKPDVKFHLYISTAPCGDSRIFAPHDEEEADKHPNRNSRGKLRTKIESGEGTIPVKSDDPIQTWDGIIQGERLLTMSCSDKVARWNVVGLQGSLLSRFVQPIYLNSIVLGGLFHPKHLHRAIIGRIQNFVQGLPIPYHINTPKMALISSKEVRNTGKAPNFSVNWTEGDGSIEIINAMTGRTEEQQVSRLAKKSLFSHYSEIVGCLPSIEPTENSALPPTYFEHKLLSSDYQLAKTEFYSAMSRAGQGKWVKKPPEAEQFEMPVQVKNEFYDALLRTGTDNSSI